MSDEIFHNRFLLKGICKLGRCLFECMDTPEVISMEEKEIRKLIAKNNLDPFYKSKQWQHTAAQARKMQHNECQRCRAKGIYSPCQIVHHKKYLRDRPDLAYDLSNLECLCQDCHNEEHGKLREAAGFQNEEKW